MASKKVSLLDSSSEDSASDIDTVARQEKRGTKRPRGSRYIAGPSEEVFDASMKHKKIQVKCNQSGKLHKASVQDLSLANGHSITEKHLTKGTEVLYEHNKKSYPVKVVKIIPENGEACSKRRKIADLNDEGADVIATPQDKDGGEGSSQAILNEIKESVSQLRKFQIVKSSTSSRRPSTSDDTSGNQEKMMNILIEIKDMVKGLCQGSSAAIKSECDGEKFTYNDINLLHIPARNMSAYGRSLLEVIFTKEEQANSVVLKTKKSDKPPLSPSRVQLLLDCVNVKYPDYDYKALMATLGQKCRDAAREIKRGANDNSQGSTSDNSQ